VRASLTTSELAQLGSAAAANVVVLARCLDDGSRTATTSPRLSPTPKNGRFGA
jgi:hypothetical protein